MAKIERSIIIDAPVEAVFNYVEDPANLPEYWPSVIEVKAVEQLPNGGARMTIAYKMAGVRFDVETACTEYVPNQRTVYESEGAVSSTLTWAYEPHETEAPGSPSRTSTRCSCPCCASWGSPS